MVCSRLKQLFYVDHLIRSVNSQKEAKCSLGVATGKMKAAMEICNGTQMPLYLNSLHYLRNWKLTRRNVMKAIIGSNGIFRSFYSAE